MPRSGEGVIRVCGETNARRLAAHTALHTTCIPELGMGPDRTHICSVDGGDTRCAMSYGLKSPQGSGR